MEGMGKEKEEKGMEGGEVEGEGGGGTQLDHGRWLANADPVPGYAAAFLLSWMHVEDKTCPP